jgi:hypothetical protein
MKKLLLNYGLLALCASLPVSAAGPGGASGNYWAASAAITNNTAETGIVVTASTQADCITQFSAAMSDHAAAHGDLFNITKNCGYVSNVIYPNAESALLELNYVGGGGKPLPLDEQMALEAEFFKDMGQLEERYRVARFIEQRDALVEQYAEQLGR